METTATTSLPIERTADVKTVPLNWGLLGVAKDFGIVLALVWYLWHTTTVTYPSLISNFSAELKAQRVHDEKTNVDLLKGLQELTGEVRKWRGGKVGD